MSDQSSFTRTAISLPDKLLKTGRKNAKRRLRNFSNYLADLISRDSAELRSEEKAKAK